MAIQATAFIGIIAGILVLAGALAAGHKARIYDAVILKVLGAVRRNVLTAFILEYAVLGLITGVIALVLGAGAGYAIVTLVMDLSFTLAPVPMALTVFGSVALTILFGLFGTWGALGVRPARILHNNA